MTNRTRKHESNLILYDDAKEILRRSGIDLKAIDVDKLRAGYSRLEQQKNEIGNLYRSSAKKLK